MSAKREGVDAFRSRAHLLLVTRCGFARHETVSFVSRPSTQRPCAWDGL